MDNLAYQYDEMPYEIINGIEYMMSSPSTNHVIINDNISSIFKNYLKGKRCRPFSGLNVFLDEENTYIPDEMIVCDPEIIEDDGIHGTPDLIVEILSKSTARFDKNNKFFTYEKYGVKEYWIVDPFSKSVEVYLLKDDKLVLDNVYSIYSDWEWNMLSKKRKDEAKFDIKVSIYDDFIVQLNDIFENVK